jgi:hypothetical protein
LLYSGARGTSEGIETYDVRIRIQRQRRRASRPARHAGLLARPAARQPLASSGGDATVTGREARLVGTSENLNGKEFVLVSDRTTIGRSQVCDIQVDEPSLSSEHARLVRSEDGWRVINLLSTNGVFVNDEKVFSHRLNDGDVIRLGRISLKFRDPNSRAGASARPSGSTRA